MCLVVPCYGDNKGQNPLLVQDECTQKDTICFDARTTGSRGSIHVSKSKTLIIKPLNRIKNEYKLQRNLSSFGSQSDLLSGLSFIPTAPSNPPSTPTAANQQPSGGALAPPTKDAIKNNAFLSDKVLLQLQQEISLGASSRKSVRSPKSIPGPATEDDARKYLQRVESDTTTKIIIILAGRGFSAADLDSITQAITGAANSFIDLQDLKAIAAGLNAGNSQALKTVADAMLEKESAAYESTPEYIQHVQGQQLSSQFDTLAQRLVALQQSLFILKNRIAGSDRQLADTLAELRAFVIGSESLDVTGMQRLREEKDLARSVLNSSAGWPFNERDKAAHEVLQLKQLLEALAEFPGYSVWRITDANKDRLTAFSSTLQADETYLNGLNPYASDRVAASGKLRDTAQHFEWVLELRPVEQTQIREVFTCGDDTKDATYTLVVTDLTDKSTSSIEVVTFTCYASLSLSGGIGFNTLPERSFRLLTPASTAGSVTPGAAAPQQIAYDKQSNFQIAPLLLLNVRVANLKNWGALHASVGAGVSIPASGGGNSTTGSGAEATYLGGGSVSLRDKIFFTAGPFFGRTNSLAGGYKVNSTLPNNVTDIPLQKKWSVGMGVAVTFKLK